MSVPEKILTNDDIAKMVETNDAWIRERTGIRERRIAREDQFPSTLGLEASIKALKVANLHPRDLDLIICSSSSPEYIFPATACLIQDQLGATKAGAFDLLAACTGFVYALNMGAQPIAAVRSRRTNHRSRRSRLVNWKDRQHLYLFGDGAVRLVGMTSRRVLSAVMHWMVRRRSARDPRRRQPVSG
jgi:3-oxoacyl-[acyl-carrier-protein] synthase-3